jgi:hypothetical protein
MNVLSLLWQRAIEDIMELGTNVDDIAESLLRIRNLGIKSTCEIIRRICINGDSIAQYITVRRILLTELLENQKVECLESENIKSIGDIIDLAGYAPTYSRIIRAVSQLPSNMRTLCEMALDKLTERGFNLKLILKILTEQKSIDDTVIDAINSIEEYLIKDKHTFVIRKFPENFISALSNLGFRSIEDVIDAYNQGSLKKLYEEKGPQISWEEIDSCIQPYAVGQYTFRRFYTGLSNDMQTLMRENMGNSLMEMRTAFLNGTIDQYPGWTSSCQEHIFEIFPGWLIELEEVKCFPSEEN